MACPGPVEKRDRFLVCRSRIHRHFLFQIFRRLFEREFAQRESYIHFHAERARRALIF